MLMAPPAKSAKMGKRIQLSLSNLGSISPVNDRDGTARYRNNQNAGYLKAGAPQPMYPGNGQNAGNLKNAGGGGTFGGQSSLAGRPKNDKFLKPGAAKKKKKPPIEDPPLPPTDGGGDPQSPPPPPPPPARKPLYVNPDWSKVVGHYFPKSEGMNDGGLVRGGGAATKGRGRGKIV